MLEKLQLATMAQALASHSSARLRLIAQNVANADTPGYRSRDLQTFSALMATGDPQPFRSAGASGSNDFDWSNDAIVNVSDAVGPNGNSVSLDREMAKSVESREAHEMALSVYHAATSILRASLGKIS